jgi:hypothetical protein
VNAAAVRIEETASSDAGHSMGIEETASSDAGHSMVFASEDANSAEE